MNRKIASAKLCETYSNRLFILVHTGLRKCCRKLKRRFFGSRGFTDETRVTDKIHDLSQARVDFLSNVLVIKGRCSATMIR